MAGPPPGFGAAAESAPTGAPPGFGTSSGPPPGFESSDAPAAPPAGFGAAVGQVQKKLAAGKSVGVALKSVRALKPVAAMETDLQKRWGLMKAHPVEAVGDFLGGLQRLVGSGVNAVEHHESFQNAVHDMWHDVTMTSNEKQNEAIRAKTTESIRALFHAPTHDAIDHFMDQHVPKQFQPYAKAIAKGGEDTALQFVSDPTSAVGGTLVKGAVKLIEGAHTATLLHAAAEANGVGKTFGFLKPVAKAYAGAADHVGTKLHETFGVRPDLDRVFTKDGRAARLSIENSEFQKATEKRFADAEAFKAGSQTERLATYQKLGAKAVKKYTPEEFGELSLGEQKKLLDTANNELRDAAIAKRSQTFFESNTDMLKAAPLKWSAVKTFDDTSEIAKAGQSLKKLPLLGAMRDLARVSIFLNPLPHGFKNVGEMAYLAGGFPALFRGVKAMTPGGRDAKILEDLSTHGGLPAYTQHTIENSIWAKVIPGWSKAAGGMQNVMEHMEAGWRVGLAETLEKKLGPAVSERDKLLRAAMVNDKIGDYRNQSAFVHLFEAIGGPFVAFRLGIVPKNVLAAIRDNPERVLMTLRGPENVQRNRDSVQAHGSGPISRGPNELEPGGPVEDFTRMVTDPWGFLLGPSTIGTVGQAFATHDYSKDHGALDTALYAGRPYVPGLDIGENVINQVTNTAMPGQKMTLADHLMSSILESVAVYYYRLQTAKQQHTTAGRVNKEGM